MRAVDTIIESLLAVRELDDLAPASHPLREIREMVNEAGRSGSILRAAARS
ncbi:hypothetical protein [Burkholderia sp. MS455]|uniref:hypothetical protein n=1 Tax=Burkholderia sp. MS455 TaxID=2811788 RepID=UPI00195E1E12|nr:hypothetical protein [Burkholderia sp. MS455]